MIYKKIYDFGGIRGIFLQRRRANHSRRGCGGFLCRGQLRKALMGRDPLNLRGYRGVCACESRLRGVKKGECNARRGRGGVLGWRQLREAVLGEVDFALQALYLLLQPPHKHRAVASRLVLHSNAHESECRPQKILGWKEK